MNSNMSRNHHAIAWVTPKCMSCRKPEDAQDLGSVWPPWARALAMIGLKFVDAESLKKYIHVAMQIARCCYVCYFFLASFIPVCKERLKQQRKEKAARSAKQKEIFHHEILGTSWDSKGCDLMDLMFFNAKRARVGWLFIWDFPLGERPPGMGSNSRPTTSPRVGCLAREMRRLITNIQQMEHDGTGKIEVWSLQDNFLTYRWWFLNQFLVVDFLYGFVGGF